MELSRLLWWIAEFQLVDRSIEEKVFSIKFDEKYKYRIYLSAVNADVCKPTKTFWELHCFVIVQAKLWIFQFIRNFMKIFDVFRHI